jgi:hypothetical protein
VRHLNVLASQIQELDLWRKRSRKAQKVSLGMHVRQSL